jgi:hypothetical protein
MKVPCQNAKYEVGFKGKAGHLTAFPGSLFQNQPDFGTSSYNKV